MCRHLHGTQPGDGSGAAGDSEVGRGLCAAGSRVSGGMAGLHAGRRAGVSPHYAIAIYQYSAHKPICGSVVGKSMRATARREWREFDQHERGRQSGLCHLHVGINGQTQRCDGFTSRPCQPSALAAESLPTYS